MHMWRSDRHTNVSNHDSNASVFRRENKQGHVAPLETQASPWRVPIFHNLPRSFEHKPGRRCSAAPTPLRCTAIAARDADEGPTLLHCHCIPPQSYPGRCSHIHILVMYTPSNCRNGRLGMGATASTHAPPPTACSNRGRHPTDCCCRCQGVWPAAAASSPPGRALEDTWGHISALLAQIALPLSHAPSTVPTA